MARRKTGPRAWVRVAHRTKDLPAGRRRWEVVYETGGYRDTGDPIRRTKGGFTTKAAAETWKAEESPAAKHATKAAWVDPANGDCTFQTVAEAWLATYVSDSGKVRGYTQHAQIVNGARSLVRECWGARRIGDITHGQVLAWIADMHAVGKSASTIRHNWYTFRLVMHHALADGLIVRDPTVKVKMPKQQSVTAQQAKRYALSPRQMLALVAATPHPWSMYVRLAAATGLRPEELTGLQLRDLSGSILTVNRVWVRNETESTWIYEDAGKTKAAMRDAPLDDATAAHLREYRRLHTARAELFFERHPDRRPADMTTLPLFPGVGSPRPGRPSPNRPTDVDMWEFTNAHGEPSPLKHAWFIRRHWSAIRAAAGLPTNVVFYDLRHFFGSYHAAELGKPGALTLAELSDRMGHASAKMTLDRYVHAEPDVTKHNASAGMWATDDTNVVPLRYA